MGTKKGMRRKTSRRAYEYTTSNKKMSEKEANKAFNSKGMSYPATVYNKNMMKNQVDKLLRKLQGRWKIWVMMMWQY